MSCGISSMLMPAMSWKRGVVADYTLPLWGSVRFRCMNGYVEKSFYTLRNLGLEYEYGNHLGFTRQ
jgi:hypothetical protein